MTSTLLVPMLICLDAASEIEFCRLAFDAQELSRRSGPDGDVVHATLQVGDTMFMVHGEYPHLESRAPKLDGSSSVVIYIYVDDVDVVIERAVRAGAVVVLPATNQAWGDRVGRIMDSAGHVWNVAAHIYGSKV
ncbi:MAG TPA: VOC family protein [Steroidobacteraceae bacterium]|nr:VOC family protein [Steroidobacteraceae bacterium]